AVLIGTSASVEACHSMEELAERFDPSSSSKSSAKFDPAELQVLSRAIVQAKPYAEAAAQLKELGIDGPKAEAFWNAVRGNIDRVADAVSWWTIVARGPEPAEFSEDDRAFLNAAAGLLP